MSRPLPATEPWAVVAGRVALRLPIQSQVEYPVCRGWGAGAWGRRCNCTLPAAPAQKSHSFLQAGPSTGEFYLCSVRHLWSTGRNWGNSPTMERGGSPSEQDTPSLPPVLVSWEPRESEQQKYQPLGPLEKGPGGGEGQEGECPQARLF